MIEPQPILTLYIPQDLMDRINAEVARQRIERRSDNLSRAQLVREWCEAGLAADD